MSDPSFSPEPASAAPSRFKLRNPRAWIAVVITLLIPGLGHVYVGQLRTAAAALLGFLILRWLILIRYSSFLELAALFVMSLLLILGFAVHAGIQARRIDAVPVRWFNRWYTSVLVLLLLAVGNQLLAPTIPFRAYRIPSSAMEPTLVVGDFLFADTSWPDRHVPQTGDLVVFDSPTDGRAFLKRCVAVAGDTVSIEGKQLYVNGEQQDEPHVQHVDPQMQLPRHGHRDFMRPIVVPPGHIFMLGDNRDNSSDSRFWGPLPIENVTGKALYIYMSIDTSGGGLPTVRWERIGRTLDLPDAAARVSRTD